MAVSLAPGDIVGVVGPEAAARSVARALVLQAAVLHGPADLAIAGLVPGGAAEWSWMRWLPHTADAAGGGPGALVATQSTAMTGVAEAAAAESAERILLAVIDGTDALTGRSAAGRMLLGLPTAGGIIVSADVCDLPSKCTTIVQIEHEAGRLRLIDPRSAAVMTPLVAWGTTVVHRQRRRGPSGPPRRSRTRHRPGQPARMGVAGGPPRRRAHAGVGAAALAGHRGSAGLRVPIGAAAEGPLVLDLVVDGPHLLIGGTTGSGKSELLRSLVAGLALSADPDHLAFVLIDYKGRRGVRPLRGDAPRRRDGHRPRRPLGERALVCLEAELRHREERLRAAGAEDLAAFRALSSPGAEPLPRLVVVVDEFATLAAELPEFLHSLVGIAQRGRSLGVHMVLATQRPAGVVTDDIRANTSCRIALRVTDRHDST